MSAQAASVQTEAEKALGEQFAALPAGEVPDWLAARREGAFGRLNAAGLPNRKVEAWRYTDLRNALKTAHPPAGRAAAEAVNVDLPSLAFAPLDALKIVIVNGFVRRDLSDLDGVAGLEIETFTEAAEKGKSEYGELLAGAISKRDDFIASYNGAFARDGVVLRIAEGANIERPIYLAYVQSAEAPHAAHTRSLVLAGRNSRATILESHVGAGQYQATSVTGMLLEEGARIDHVKAQNDALDAIHLGLLAVRLGAGSRLNSFSGAYGAALSRHQVQAAFDGAGADLRASGTLLLRGRQHSDATLFIDHAVPECTSQQLYKAVLDGEARGVFQGGVLVRPGAQRTDGRQSSRALLLSDQAEMDAKPELEIFADDVQCAHGATVGQLDEQLIFYLRSRGIPQAQAEALLVEAFIADALAEIGREDVREILQQTGRDWLAGRKG